VKGRIADRTIVEIEAFGASEAMIERLRSVAGVASVSVELREQAQVILVQSSHGPELVQPLLRELMIGLAYIGGASCFSVSSSSRAGERRHSRRCDRSESLCEAELARTRPRKPVALGSLRSLVAKTATKSALWTLSVGATSDAWFAH
jgi:hypothetical protein